MSVDIIILSFMINSSSINSLLGKLSENVLSLESRYRDFSSKCIEKEDMNSICFGRILEKYDEICNYILSLKESFKYDCDILTFAKGCLENCIQDSCNQWKIDKNVIKMIESSIECINTFLFTSVKCTNNKYDTLHDLIINQKKINQQYQRNLENKLSIIKEHNNNQANFIIKKDQIIQVSSRSCHECEKICNESKSIVLKMNQLVEKINVQVKDLSVNEYEETPRERYSLSSSRENFYKIKTAPAGFKDIEYSRESIRTYQENEIKSLAVSAKNQSLAIEVASKDSTISKLETIINQNDTENKRLLNELKELKELKKFKEENKDKLETLKALQENYESKINQLEQENYFNIQELNQMTIKNSILAKDNEQLFQSYSLQRDFKVKSATKLQEQESLTFYSSTNSRKERKYKAKLLKKNEEINKLNEKINENQASILEIAKNFSNLQISYENVNISLKENTKKFNELAAANENKKNKLNIISVHNINLANGKKQINKYEIMYNDLQNENTELNNNNLQIKEDYQNLLLSNKNLNKEINMLNSKLNEM